MMKMVICLQIPTTPKPSPIVVKAAIAKLKNVWMAA
jgi:hypothetical protein